LDFSPELAPEFWAMDVLLVWEVYNFNGTNWLGVFCIDLPFQFQR